MKSEKNGKDGEDNCFQFQYFMLLTCKLPQWLNAANVFNNKFFDRSIDYRFRDIRMSTTKKVLKLRIFTKMNVNRVLCTLMVQNLLVLCYAAYWFGLILYSCGKDVKTDMIVMTF